MSNVYVYINKQAGKTRWVWGDALPGKFQKLDALKLLLGPFLDKSRAVVATNFGCPTCIC